MSVCSQFLQLWSTFWGGWGLGMLIVQVPGASWQSLIASILLNSVRQTRQSRIALSLRFIRGRSYTEAVSARSDLPIKLFNRLYCVSCYVGERQRSLPLQSWLCGCCSKTVGQESFRFSREVDNCAVLHCFGCDIT